MVWTLIDLPVHLPIQLDNRFLHNLACDLPTEFIQAHIVGFSITAGEPIRINVKVDGGRFYDLPLESTGNPYWNQERCYAVAPSENAKYYPNEYRSVNLFGRAGKMIIKDAVWCGCLEWGEDNLLLYLVITRQGGAMLWPPHKCLEHGTELPGWEKFKHKLPTFRWNGGSTLYDSFDHLRGIDLIRDAQLMLASSEGWRHHGLGVLQKYHPLDPDRRLHLWHEDLICDLEAPIHNHRWDLESEVIYGDIIQEEYEITAHPYGPYRISNTENTEITSRPETKDLARYAVRPYVQKVYCGESYRMPAGVFHLTRIELPAATWVTKENSVGVSQVLVPYDIPHARNGITGITQDPELIEHILNKFRRCLA